MDGMVCRHGFTWDLPNMIYADTGKRCMGTEYNQNMILWALPAALAGQDLAGPCQPNGLVYRVLHAAKEKPERNGRTAQRAAVLRNER